MLKSVFAFAVTWFPVAYLMAAWLVCARFVFDREYAILAIGVFVGITVPGYFRLVRGRRVLSEKDDNTLDVTAKIVLVVVSLCFCAMVVKQIDTSFRLYRFYAGSPIYAVGMIYVPAFILGIASTGYVKLIAILVRNLGQGQRGQIG